MATNPKLFDVVRFSPFSAEAQPPAYTGTVVELFGSDTALIELADESGVTKKLMSIPIRDLTVIWSSSETQTDEEEPGAQQYFEEGVFLLQNGASPDAKEQFKKAFAIQPNLTGTLMNLTNDLAVKRAFDSALFLYRLIAELQPEYQLARENLARTHLNRGVEYAHAGALDKALEDFTAALFFEGSDEIVNLSRHNLAAAHTQIGLHHIKIKRFSEAFQFFLAALQAHPSDVTRRNFALALVSLSASKHEGWNRLLTEDLFREPMLIGLKYSECLNAYGATVASFGKTSEAKEILKQATMVDPSNQLAQSNLRILAANEFSDVARVDMWGLTPVKPEAAGVHLVER